MLRHPDKPPVIRHPGNQDLPRLMALWQEAFGDTPEETAFYFHYRHRHENMLVFESANTVHGMLSLLPVKLVFNGREWPARYIFAVATAFDSRGRGISSALLEEAHRQSLEAGCAATLLVPAEASLFGYYQKRGYETAFHIAEKEFFKEILNGSQEAARLEPCGAEDYLAIRNQHFLDHSRLYAQWDREALEFIRLSARAGGGDMVAIKGIDWEGAAVYEGRDGYTRVTELLGPGEKVLEMLACIHRAAGADRYLLRLQANADNIGKAKPFGMVHWLADKRPAVTGGAPYLAFAKD